MSAILAATRSGQDYVAAVKKYHTHSKDKKLGYKPSVQFIIFFLDRVPVLLYF